MDHGRSKNNLTFPRHDGRCLIGIGDFSHGDNNIWEYRISFVNHLLQDSSKHITIFNEDTEYHSNNITDITKPLSFESEYNISEDGYGYGPLDEYCHRVYDSSIYLTFIRLVRMNHDRISLIGVDVDEIDRDYQMAQNILTKLDKSHVNLFFAHNSHVNDQTIFEDYETKWSSEEKRCGHYLRKKLGDEYCIMLSASGDGVVRFDCDCNDKFCTKRRAYKVPVFREFNITEYGDLKVGLYENFPKDIITFTACTFNGIPLQYAAPSSEANYVLFLGTSRKLELVETCTVCKRIAEYNCSSCSVPYCSEKCQKYDWHQHEHVCYQFTE